MNSATCVFEVVCVQYGDYSQLYWSPWQGFSLKIVANNFFLKIQVWHCYCRLVENLYLSESVLYPTSRVKCLKLRNHLLLIKILEIFWKAVLRPYWIKLFFQSSNKSQTTHIKLLKPNHSLGHYNPIWTLASASNLRHWSRSLVSFPVGYFKASCILCVAIDPYLLTPTNIYFFYLVSY